MEGLPFLPSPDTLQRDHYNASTSWDYLVLSSVFLGSMGIAGCFGAFGKLKAPSADEFLMGEREMSIFPVAMSLFSSFVSTVTVLGGPLEVYLYGTQYALVLLPLIPVSLVLLYLYLPVYFNMELSSPFEYFERRFSRGVRVFVSTLSLAQMTIYITLVAHCTSTALYEGTGVNNKIFGAIIFVVCIFCSLVGGYKGVVWANMLEAVVLLGSSVTVVVMAFLDVEDLGLIWKNALNGNRIEFLNFDPDPRARHTVWTSLIGGYFLWISLYAGGQPTIQRLISLPSLQKAKRSFVLSICGLITILTLCFTLGILLFGKYFDCDPLIAQEIGSYSQLLPHFVSNVFAGYPGLWGLFLAAISCACLRHMHYNSAEHNSVSFHSTVSSNLNSMVSLVAYDFLKFWIPNISEESLIFLSKILNVVLGGISFALVIVADNTEQILSAAWSITGMTLGPIFGLFTLGMFFPWANGKGALLGTLATIIFSIYAIVLSDMVRNEGLLPDQRLPLISSGCENRTLSLNFTKAVELEPNRSPFMPSLSSAVSWNRGNGPNLIQVVSMSYLWYPGLSCCGTIVLGLLFSLLFIKFQKNVAVSPECFSPPILKLWVKWFPSHMANWVAQDETLMLLSTSDFSFLPKMSARRHFKSEPRCEVEIKPVSQDTL